MGLVIVVCLWLTAGPVAAADAPQAELPRPQIKNPLALNGSVATAWGKLRPLKPERYRDREVEFRLGDGTRIGGLMFYRSGQQPLLICTFGFLADRRSRVAAHWIRRFVARERIEAHVLVLDHPTSSLFYADNGHLSIGGHDEGRLLTEVARQLRRSDEAGRISTIHLLGVSMGGMGVVHALLEDARLGSGLFSSAITFSAVSDLAVAPVSQLSHFSKKGDPSGPWGTKVRSRKRNRQEFGIGVLFKRFRRVVEQRTGTPLEVERDAIGAFFYEAFSARLEHLATAAARALDPPWNPSFPRDSLEAYIAGCDLTRHIAGLSLPLIMVHAKDDPVVPYEQLQRVEFVGNAKDHPYLTTLGVQQGGHFGFNGVYRSAWLLELVHHALRLGEATVEVTARPDAR